MLAIRDLDRGTAAVDDIEASAPGAQLELQQLDLGNLASIHDAAAALAAGHPQIDCLVNNAGVMYPPYRQTTDGFELQIGTNHLGHFALTGLLLPQLLEMEGSRIVTVSSQGHRIMSKIDLDDLHTGTRYNRVAAYGRSKLANLLFTYQLQRRLDRANAATAALAAHPGSSDTELDRHMPGGRLTAILTRGIGQSASMGALPTLRAATDPDATGGAYYGPDGLLGMRGHPVRVNSSRRAHDEELQRSLWQLSERQTAVAYPI